MKIRELMAQLTDDQLAEVWSKAEAHDGVAAQLEKARARERGRHIDRHALAKRVRNAMVGEAHGRFVQAKRANDAAQSPEGDSRVLALGLLRQELAGLDIEGLDEPLTDEDLEAMGSPRDAAPRGR